MREKTLPGSLGTRFAIVDIRIEIRNNFIRNWRI